MALSDCPKCWETPCMCGHGYEKWTVRRRVELATILLKGTGHSVESAGYVITDKGASQIKLDEPVDPSAQ